MGIRVGSTTSVSQSINLSSSSSSTNITTGMDALASSHTWSAGTCLEVFPLGQTRLLALSLLQASAQA